MHQKRITKKPHNKAKSASMVRLNKQLSIPRPDILHMYLRYNQILQYLEYLERNYSNFVTVHTIGYSYEKRPLKAIEIDWCSPKNIFSVAKVKAETVRLNSAPAAVKQSSSEDIITKLNQCETRNIVFIEAGAHAREWITISVALNCIYQLTEKNARYRDVLRKMRFFIVPVVNPDGYEYSLTKNRRWRKNRRPHQNSKSIGTDCNRNYDFQWGDGAAKSHRNTYKGEKPFSEPETRAIRNTLQNLAPYLLFFLSLHSYAESIMYPWGYTKDLPDNWNDLDKLAQVGCEAIKSYSGRKYRVGSISSLTKRTISGSVVDYAYGSLKVPLALVIELPSRQYGFQPPCEAISQLGHESWFGIREMCKSAYALMPPNKAKHTDEQAKDAATLPSSVVKTEVKDDETSTSSEEHCECDSTDSSCESIESFIEHSLPPDVPLIDDITELIEIL